MAIATSKSKRAGSKISDFSISYSNNNTISSCPWMCRVIHFPLQFGRALGIAFTTNNNSFIKCWNVRLSSIQSVRYQNEKKILMPEPVRSRNKGTQSGTGMLRYRTEIQDAGMPTGIALDANAQLWSNLLNWPLVGRPCTWGP